MKSIATLEADVVGGLLELLKQQTIPYEVRTNTQQSGLDVSEIMVEDGYYDRACDVAEKWEAVRDDEAEKRFGRQCPKCNAQNLLDTSDFQASPARGSIFLDLLGLGLMSVSAFWVAACIQSICIFHGYSELYNAPVGGAYFFNLLYSRFETRTDKEAMSLSIVALLVECGVAGILTLLVLFGFRKVLSHRWVVWCCCVVAWSYVLYKSQVHFH